MRATIRPEAQLGQRLPRCRRANRRRSARAAGVLPALHPHVPTCNHRRPRPASIAGPRHDEVKRRRWYQHRWVPQCIEPIACGLNRARHCLETDEQVPARQERREQSEDVGERPILHCQEDRHQQHDCHAGGSKRQSDCDDRKSAQAPLPLRQRIGGSGSFVKPKAALSGTAAAIRRPGVPRSPASPPGLRRPRPRPGGGGCGTSCPCRGRSPPR